LFPFEMIHLSTLTLVFLHFTINQELWGTLQQNLPKYYKIFINKKNIERMRERPFCF
jgi:hypothetical protein